MDNTDVIGGVSPLKQKRGKRGGKAARKATSTKGRRGGFAKTTKGSGSKNLGGYNKNTRFKAREPWKKPASSGPSSSKTAPPFSNGLPDINIVNNNINTLSGAQQQQQQQQQMTTNQGEWVDPVYGTRKVTTKGKTTWDEAWGKNFKIKDGKRVDKYGHEYSDDAAGFEDFKKAGRKYNKETGSSSETSTTRDERYKISDGYYKQGGSIITSSQQQSQSQGTPAKFTLKGNPMFRNFGIGGEAKK